MEDLTRKIIVCTHPDGSEAIYVDGELVDDDQTIYACDIAEHAFQGAVPVLFDHVCTSDFEGGWPQSLDDVPLECA